MPQISTKIEWRVSVTLDTQRLVRVLLRLEQRARRHRVAEFLHKLAHNDRQFTGNLIFQLRISLFRGNLFREVHNHRRRDTPPRGR